MARKRPAPPSPSGSTSKKRLGPSVFASRDGLGAYIASPTSYPPSRMIYHNADFVAIHDMYPKSSVHALLLPRSAQHNLLHPFDAFADPTFLSAVKAEAARLKALVAAELRRKYGKDSAQERAREAAMEQDPSPETLPPGRDWAAEVKVGVHAHPSMRHLHVHVLSVDHVSECLRKRSHYNSFTTPFLVPLDAFPLATDNPWRHPGRGNYLVAPLECWRCRRKFGDKFAQLKEHLEEEFLAWRAE
ncbi:MAG: aprataxin-like protein [Thelocarpon impressellum]|nr:MAG: aprataxin-like protein [Thelocarpon impressellum]